MGRFGSISSDVTAIAVADGGTGASTAAGARANLGISPKMTWDGTSIASSGEGQFLDVPTQYSVNVADTESVSLIRLRGKATETVAAGSQLYLLKIDTDADQTDTGAGVAIFNFGTADGIYLANRGKSTGHSGNNNPSGIGIDMNRGTGGAQHNAVFAGTGLHVWDFTSTDNTLSNGPRGIFMSKINNMDSTHAMLWIRSNRHSIYLEVDETDPAYDPSRPVLLQNGAKWRLLANGNQQIKNGTGLIWDVVSGNQATLTVNSGNSVQLRVGTGGFDILNNSGSRIAFFSNSNRLDCSEGMNITTGTTTGTKIGTATTQKIGFFNATPVVRPSGVAVTAEGIHAALVSLGLIAA